jgi:hypothetical protein
MTMTERDGEAPKVMPEGVEVQLTTGDWIGTVRMSYAGRTGYRLNVWYAVFPRGTLAVRPLGMRVKMFPAGTRIEIREESRFDAFIDEISAAVDPRRLTGWIGGRRRRGSR